jgi:3-phytase
MPRTFALAMALFCCTTTVAAADGVSPPTAVVPRMQTAASVQDAASDVAIWVHPTDPERSLVVGAGGTAGLEIFGLDGASVQRLPAPQVDFVDVRYGVAVGDRTGDLVLAVDVSQARLHFFHIDPGARSVAPLPGEPIALGTEVTGLCSYRSPVTGKVYAIVTTDDGDLEQLELHARGGALEGRSIRRVPLGRGAGACDADDASQTVIIAVETTGLWRLAAEPESDATPVQLEALAPFGALAEEVKGAALYRADADTVYLLAADIGQGALRAYDLDGKRLGTITLAAGGTIPAVAETEALALVPGALPGFDGGVLAVADEDNGDAYANYKLIAVADIATSLGLAVRGAQPVRDSPVPTALVVEPTVETEPVSTYGDAADDPAIWVHPGDASQSLIIGANKKLGLEVYDLTGRRVQTLPDGRINNVDLRDGFAFEGAHVSLVAASNRTSKTIALYRVDVATRRLVALELEDAATGLRDPYGVCLYRSARSGRFYLFVNDADTGLMRQWRLEERRGRIRATQVRDMQVGSQAEGCVADDELGWLYLGEEDTGLWKYGAEPNARDKRTAVDRTDGGNLTADVEGMSLWRGPGGTGYLVVSNQGEDNYAVYRREGANEFVGKFHVVANEESGIDGASETDGLDVTSASLGAGLEHGLLVVQDGRNLTPSERQNFKLIPWSRIGTALGLTR